MTLLGAPDRESGPDDLLDRLLNSLMRSLLVVERLLLATRSPQTLMDSDGLISVAGLKDGLDRGGSVRQIRAPELVVLPEFDLIFEVVAAVVDSIVSLLNKSGAVWGSSQYVQLRAVDCELAVPAWCLCCCLES